MKKFCLIFYLLVFAFVGLTPFAHAIGEGCVIHRIEGKGVSIIRGQHNLAMLAGGILENGDRITTGANSSIDISLSGQTGFRILPGSQIEILEWRSENMTIKLDRGDVLLKVKKFSNKSQFRVETPTATATVYGTKFWGRVTIAGSAPVTTFTVSEGQFDVTPKQKGAKPVQVSAEQVVDIAAKADTATVRSAQEAEMEFIQEADSIDVEYA